VALGKYDIVVATGERWRGLRKARQGKPFWPSASRYKLDALFSFDRGVEDETRVRHHIELIDQSNGNLSKTPIFAAEFGD
jgi:hypothetical protein